jgi:hypothetical protein
MELFLFVHKVKNTPLGMLYSKHMEMLPLEKLIAKVEAVQNGESDKTREDLVTENTEFWVAEAEEWSRLTNA